MVDTEEIKGFAYRMLEDRLMKILSVDRPQGEWIEVDDYFIRCKCSICGWESHKYEDDVYGMPYCPNCGARMFVKDINVLHNVLCKEGIDDEVN